MQQLSQQLIHEQQHMYLYWKQSDMKFSNKTNNTQKKNDHLEKGMREI